MRKLTALLLFLAASPAFAAAPFTVGTLAVTGDASVAGTVTGTVVATGQTTGDTLANRFSDVINLKHDCGAVGNGVADDSGALKTCIDEANADYAAGKPVVIYVPAGTYLIKATQIPAFAPHVPGAIVGAGPLKSFFVLDPSYAGNLFAWSEAWMASTWVSPFNPATNEAGPLVEGITVTGSTSAAAQQNAFEFLDRDDHVLMKDVDVLYLNGACISMGSTLAEPEAYVRESLFQNVKCWNTGTATVPAVTISSTTDNSSSDATNEVKFFGLDVFGSAGTGIVISNPNQWGSTRGITFYNARVEDSGKDGIDVGLSTDLGQVQGIRFYNLDEPGIAAGYYGLKITTGGSYQPYAISVFGGQIGSGGGYGVDVDNARQVDLDLDNMATSSPEITLGANAGPQIMVRGNGAEYSYTYSVPAAQQQYLALPTLNHATATSEAIDIQTGSRTATTHFASGTGAFAAGQDNTASGNFSVAIGDANAVSGTQGVALGASNTVTQTTSAALGFGNSLTGQSEFAAGYQNVLSGIISSAPGGQAADDFGRYGWRGQANGDFSTAGDAQFGRMVLRASTTSTTTIELTANGGAASGTTIPVVQNNSAQSFSVQLIARDVTTSGNYLSYSMPVALIYRGATPATTTVSLGTPASVAVGTGSPSQVSIAADTTSGGIAVNWTAPNTDTWHVVATVKMTEVQ